MSEVCRRALQILGMIAVARRCFFSRSLQERHADFFAFPLGLNLSLASWTCADGSWCVNRLPGGPMSDL